MPRAKVNWASLKLWGQVASSCENGVWRIFGTANNAYEHTTWDYRPDLIDRNGNNIGKDGSQNVTGAAPFGGRSSRPPAGAPDSGSKATRRPCSSTRPTRRGTTSVFALPYGQRKARRLRLSWLNTIAAVSAPIPAILAIVDFLQFLGVLGDGRIALSWLSIGTLVVLNAVVLVLTHVVQRPTIRRGGVVRVPAVDDRVASEWAGLAGDQVRIIRPTA